MWQKLGQVVVGLDVDGAPEGVQDDRGPARRSFLVGIDLLGDTADEFLDVARAGMLVGVQMRAEFPGAALQPRAVPLLE